MLQEAAAAAAQQQEEEEGEGGSALVPSVQEPTVTRCAALEPCAEPDTGALFPCQRTRRHSPQPSAWPRL
jgi:hypothetical protein